MKALVYGFGCFWCHGAHGETLCHNDVGGYHCAFVLCVTHFFKRGVQGDSKFAAIIKCSKFRFRYRGHDVFDDG